MKTKLIDILKDQLEQEIYNEMWQEFIDEQQKQVERMDKLIREVAIKRANVLEKKLRKEINSIRSN